MSDVERAIQQMRRSDFVEHPRDLDEGRPLQVPQTPDLFADGLEIAQHVLDWEQKAGQPITSLIDHLRAEEALRKSVVEKAQSESNEGAQG